MFSAGQVLAQSPVTGGDWGNSAGDAVAIHPNGQFDVAITDGESSVFAGGKVVDRKVLSDGRVSFTLKPVGGKIDLFIVEVSPDGASCDIYVVKGGARRKVETLNK